jgi:flagellar biosynthesis anti-sigma factor FlgM
VDTRALSQTSSRAAGADGGAATGTTAEGDGVKVTVSRAAETLAKKTSGVDQSKVDSLKAMMAAGSFSVDHLQLARTMLARG